MTFLFIRLSYFIRHLYWLVYPIFIL